MYNLFILIYYVFNLFKHYPQKNIAKGVSFNLLQLKQLEPLSQTNSTTCQ